MISCNLGTVPVVSFLRPVSGVISIPMHGLGVCTSTLQEDLQKAQEQQRERERTSKPQRFVNGPCKVLQICRTSRFFVVVGWRITSQRNYGYKRRRWVEQNNCTFEGRNPENLRPWLTVPKEGGACKQHLLLSNKAGVLGQRPNPQARARQAKVVSTELPRPVLDK